jgi:hypothetical protein
VELTSDWDYTALLSAFGGKNSSSFRCETKDELDALLSSETFATGRQIQLVDVVMPVMDAPRALIEQARLLELANRRADVDEAPPAKKRKRDHAAANGTANGIGFHGLTNGAELLSV